MVTSVLLLTLRCICIHRFHPSSGMTKVQSMAESVIRVRKRENFESVGGGRVIYTPVKKTLVQRYHPFSFFFFFFFFFFF